MKLDMDNWKGNGTVARNRLSDLSHLTVDVVPIFFQDAQHASGIKVTLLIWQIGTFC